MLLKELLEDIWVKDFDSKLENTDVKDIKIDASQIEKGDMYIALQGSQHNGNDFIDQAVSRGAAVVVSDMCRGEKIVTVPNARNFYALACKNFFGRSCDRLKNIAITGTNGKTTICSAVAEMLRSAGAKVGSIGTLGARVGKEVIDTGLTTPDPYMLHKLFAKMEEEGCEYVVMEASAHALALDKLDGIKFEIGVLTNITEDHLDYFGDMDNYAQAKYKLFTPSRVKLGIIYGDDLYGQKLMFDAAVPMISYGIGSGYDISAKDVQKSISSSQFLCQCFGEMFQVKSWLVGDYNIKNALAAVGVCRSLGVPKELVQLGLSCLTPAEGRFNVINIKGANVVIDYAHTPDGLENLLKTAKELTNGKLVVVFGCGGNRDKLKRPVMGRVASRYADHIILTSDNPRDENPMEIINEISVGIKKKKVNVIENRKQAIEYALENFKDDATIVIAGKGAEKYQEIKGKKIPYNDFDVVYNFYRSQFEVIDGIDEEIQRID